MVDINGALSEIVANCQNENNNLYPLLKKQEERSSHRLVTVQWLHLEVRPHSGLLSLSFTTFGFDSGLTKLGHF